MSTAITLETLRALPSSESLLAVALAADELAFCDYLAEIESYNETVPGSCEAARARASDAHSALMRAVDAMREAVRAM